MIIVEILRKRSTKENQEVCLSQNIGVKETLFNAMIMNIKANLLGLVSDIPWYYFCRIHFLTNRILSVWIYTCIFCQYTWVQLNEERVLLLHLLFFFSLLAATAGG